MQCGQSMFDIRMTSFEKVAKVLLVFLLILVMYLSLTPGGSVRGRIFANTVPDASCLLYSEFSLVNYHATKSESLLKGKYLYQSTAVETSQPDKRVSNYWIHRYLIFY